jgi:hypothetical protein
MFQNFHFVGDATVEQQVLTTEDVVAYNAMCDANDVPKNFCSQWC